MENVRIRDANNRSVHICGTIDLAVNIGGSVENVRFNVVECIATHIILGCGYCANQIKSIRPRKRLVLVVDRTVVPIIKKTAPRAKEAIKIAEEQEYEPARCRSSIKISVLAPPYYNPSHKTWLQYNKKDMNQ